EDIYLPSLDIETGQTISSYLPRGIHGTSCAPTGACKMSEVYPVPEALRRLLESRPVEMWPTGPFEGLSRCHLYTQLPAGSSGPGDLENPQTGALYSVEIDPNTGKAVNTCGPNSGWQLNWQPAWMPPRGTENTAQLYQIAVGLR